MTIEIAEDAIQHRFQAAWNDLFPQVPYSFENEKVQNPTGPSVILVVVPEGENIAAYGAGRGKVEWDVVGRIEIKIFVPLNAGKGFLRELTREAAGIFRGQQFSRVMCQGAFPSGGGDRADKGSVYMSTVVVDFIYRHIG